MPSITKLSLALLLGSLAFAHPGEEHHEEEPHAALAKRALFESAKRTYPACSNSNAKRALNDRLAERREAEIASLRSSIAARKLTKRQDAWASGAPSGTAPSGAIPSGGAGPSESGAAGGSGGGGGGSASFDSTGEALLNTSHASSLTGLTVNATASTLFGDDTTCLLQPEVTIGPYWVAGEYVRYDVSEDQEGIPLYLSTHVIDVGSCEPVSGLYWEIWHCNSSGVYSGVVASGNGDTSDESNINKTFLRGLQPTDDDGVVAQQTIFPGHYTGRATHIHVVGHANATVYANGTIGTGSSGDGDSAAVHIGQLFFDQDLLDAVATVSPYSENTQTVTANDEDTILASEAVEGASDPFYEFVYLGDDISDGIYAWATVGITINTTYATSAAAYLTSDGGVTNSDSNAMGGGMNSSELSGNSSSESNGSSAYSSAVAADVDAASTTSSAAVTTSTASPSASTTISNAASRNLPTIAAVVGSWIRRAIN
ncbi:hypothetical protein IAT40_006988 [Kwoniella sp. CBS 6097]